MKIKKGLAIVICLLCLGVLFSCRIKNDTNTGQSNAAVEDFIYNETSELTLEIPDGQLSDENRKLLTDALYPYKIYYV